MPTADQILDGLTAISATLVPVAIGWHVAMAGVVVAAIAGWRPPNHVIAGLMVMPAASVAAAALVGGNGFNAISFGVLAFALAEIGANAGGELRVAPPWAYAIGLLLVAFGWAYPHFVPGPAWGALFAAPVGVVPCPTLAVLAGVALITNGAGSRAMLAVLGAWSAFYALFGVLRLGVVIDVGLLLAPVALAVSALAKLRVHATQP